MSSDDLLSQDEIDALLHGVDLGQLDPDFGHKPLTGEAAVYDFFSQDRIVPVRMPALESIYERFSRGLRGSISAIVCNDVEISLSGVQMLKFSQFVQDLHAPISLHLVAMKPLPGVALFVMDPALVFRTVECFFGGDGRSPLPIEAKAVTPMEQGVIGQVLEQAFTVLQQAWSPVLALEPEWLGTETGTGFDQLFDAAEALVTAEFNIRFQGEGGALRIAMPYAMLEPILDRLDAGIINERRRDNDWRDAILDRLQSADVRISSAIVETAFTLRQVAMLEPGDVIPIDLPRQVVLRAEQVPVYWGEFGIHRGSYAIKIRGPYVEAQAEDSEQNREDS